MSETPVEFHTGCWWFTHEGTVYWSPDNTKDQLEQFRQHRLVNKIPYSSKERFMFPEVYSEMHKVDYPRIVCNNKSLVAITGDDNYVLIFSSEYEI